MLVEDLLKIALHGFWLDNDGVPSRHALVEEGLVILLQTFLVLRCEFLGHRALGDFI